MEFAIGVDLGGTHVTAATVDARGRVRRRFKDALRSHSPAHVVAKIAALVRKAEAALPAQRVAAVGLGSPGNIDERNGSVRFSPNFGWHDVPLRALLEKKMQRRLYILNDARCATLGEYLHGSGRGCREFALITIGTGIGGGLVCGGRLVLGAYMGAGEVGHHTIRPETGFVCSCGKTGCFEVQASAAGLIRHVLALAPSFPQSRLLASQPSESWGSDMIVAAVQDGDMHAAAAWKNYLADLAIGVSNIISFTNPQAIALGGGGAQVPAAILSEPLTALVDERTTMAPKGKTRIVTAQLGNDAGAVGAAALARMGGVQALITTQR
jgi:glucokinase